MFKTGRDAMSLASQHFALLGATPLFDKVVPVGQLYFPSWARYEAAMRGIFNRQYYTNNGPLLAELESKLQGFFGVKHAICVLNATFGLMMVADAMELTGKVILPSFTFIASAQSLSWAGIEPVFCDIDPITHHVTSKKIEALIDDGVSGIMGVNLWGGGCDVHALQTCAEVHGLRLYFDSAHAFGCEVNGQKIAGFGNAEVFSFHATKILSATEGGCICTNDDDLADRLRAIRPSYGNVRTVEVHRVINARMSEAQAAIALMSLEDFPKNRQHNEDMFCLYRQMLAPIPGIRLVEPAGVSFSNYQYVVCEVDEAVFGLSRDSIIAVLKAENVNARRYFYPGVHRSIEYRANPSGAAGKLPTTENLCEICFQLPIGAPVDADIVGRICEILALAHLHAPKLQAKLADMNP